MHKYITKSSPVFICFLDASKAYDRVNHCTLFRILLDRGIPLYIVRVLKYWYQFQVMCVQWGSTKSAFFQVTNGVRQGGVLSPALFNVYIDQISRKLNNKVNIGCSIGNVVVNNLVYADDMCLMAPSAKGLQELIDICLIEAKKLNILYNMKKTVCMCVQPKKWKLNRLPVLYLDGSKIEYVVKYKYLGYFIFNDLTDDADVQRQIRSMYSRANMLLRKFGKCSKDVKVQLFKSYLGNTYCSQLWANVKRTQIQKLKIAYNNSLRIFFNLPRMCSISNMFVTIGIPSYAEFSRKEIYSFWKRVEGSENLIVNSLAGSWVMFMDLSIFDRWYATLYGLNSA